MFMHFANLIC